MGDARYERSYDALLRARDRGAAIHALGDEQIVEALAASAKAHDPFLSNVLATEAMNRVRRLRAALAHLGEGILVLGLDGKVLWMNPAAEKLLGVAWGDAAFRPFDEIVEHVDPARKPLDQTILARAARGEGHTADGEWFCVREGKTLCVSYTSAPIFADGGEPDSAVVAFQDCGERKAHEREVRESRERYKVIFDRSELGIVSVTLDGRVLDFNPAAERITRRPIREAQGRPWADFLHPDDVASVMQTFGAILRGEESTTRIRLRHRDGHYVLVEALGIPIVVDGEVVGLHGMLKPVPDGSAGQAPPHGP